MRRQIIILLALLMLVLPVAAQEWPDSFTGDQTHFKEATAFQMYLLSWHDRNPWGIADMTGRFFYFGSLVFDYCYGENIASLTLDTMASRRCINDNCYYYAPQSMSLHYTLVWNEKAGAYLVLGGGYWGTNVIALVLNSDEDSGIMLMGTMQLSSSGAMVWDDTYTHYTYIIEPMAAKPMKFFRRSFGRRIGVN